MWSLSTGTVDTWRFNDAHKEQTCNSGRNRGEGQGNARVLPFFIYILSCLTQKCFFLVRNSFARVVEQVEGENIGGATGFRQECGHKTDRQEASV